MWFSKIFTGLCGFFFKHQALYLLEKTSKISNDTKKNSQRNNRGSSLNENLNSQDL